MHIIALAVALVLLMGTAAPAGRAPQATDARLAGSWRVLSARLFYDAGGAGTVDTTITRQLELGAGGTWAFGASEGTWEVAAIADADWDRWQVPPFGPTRKLTLHGWSDDVADGPIEEDAAGGEVHSLWVLYRVGPPAASAPGTVHMKLGRAPGSG